MNVSDDSVLIVRRFIGQGWLQFALALSYLPVVAFEHAGRQIPLLDGLLLLLALVCSVPIQCGIIVWCWKSHRWTSVAALLALVTSLYYGGGVGRRWGDQLIRDRFMADRAQYDLVADQILRGSYPKGLRPEHAHLGYWARPETVSNGNEPAAGKPIGVAFLVVSHGYAGHLGFFRLTEPAKAGVLLKGPAPGSWASWGEHLDGAWYVVTN